MKIVECENCNKAFGVFPELADTTPIQKCPYCEFDRVVEPAGLYTKFRVERLNDPTDKHKDCEYFVLDLNHDKFSKPALLAYADACEREYPELAADLRNKFR